MQARAALAFLVVAAALVGRPASAQTLTGTWVVTVSGPRGGSLTQTFALTQDGSALTGTVTITGGGRRGGGGGGLGGRGLGGPVPIGEGTVTGSAFSFTTTIEFNGNSFTQRYTGTFTGDAMQGTIEGGRGGSNPFIGSREG